MNPKIVIASLAIAILLCESLEHYDILAHQQHGESLVEHHDMLAPELHIHQESKTETVVATNAEINNTGGQGAFEDNSFYSPAFNVHHTYDQQMLQAALAINSDEGIPPLFRNPVSLPSDS